MKRRKFTIIYRAARAAVAQVRKSKYHPRRYEVLPILPNGEIFDCPLYESDDVLIAQEYARLSCN